MTSGTPAQSGNVADQIAFARHNFDNHQSLLRFSDTKAGAVLTFAIFLAGSALTFARDASHKLAAQPCSTLVLSLTFLGTGVVFLLAFLWLVWGAHEVLKPRGARHYGRPTPGADLLWQDHVLAHGSQKQYLTAVSAASPDLILQNLTDQVFELASISRDKMNALAHARYALIVAFIFWIANVLCGIVLVR